jgi:hypothetical protein
MKDFIEKLLQEKETAYDNIAHWFAEEYMDCKDDELVKENEVLQTKLNIEINLLYVIIDNMCADVINNGASEVQLTIPDMDVLPNYKLNFCSNCFQMTNQLNDICQKCKKLCYELF